MKARPVPTCYLCGTAGDLKYPGLKDRMSIAPGLWDIRSCPGCGLAWVDPQPLPEMIPQLYAHYYTHQGPEPALGATWASRLKRAARAGVLAAAFGYSQGMPRAVRLLGRLVSWLPAARDTVGASIRWLPASQRGRLLDVGCGSGDFLAEMRGLGWDVTGIEPDPIAAEHARKDRGLTVETGTLETTTLAADSFDVITLNHVIEHVADPIATLRACGRLLRQSGRLVIVTPNAGSLGQRVFGSAWQHWDPPRHFYLFTADTLRTCVARADLVPGLIRTPAHGTRPCWGNSRMIGRQQGPRPARDRPQHIKIEEGVALFAESFLVGLGHTVGEEIALVAGRR